MKSPRKQTVHFVNTSFTVFFLSDFTGRRPSPSLYVENGEREERPPDPQAGWGPFSTRTGNGERLLPTNLFPDNSRGGM